jgi:hypothetical protein
MNQRGKRVSGRKNTMRVFSGITELREYAIRIGHRAMFDVQKLFCPDGIVSFRSMTAGKSNNFVI